jgi:ribosome-associated protein
MARKSRRKLAALEQEAAAADEPENDDELDEGPSRTQRKNASKALTRLGEGLLSLRSQKIEALDLPDSLLAALAEAKRLTSFGAKRRQAQFIGKLMRKLDLTTVAAIRKALDLQ